MRSVRSLFEVTSIKTPNSFNNFCVSCGPFLLVFLALVIQYLLQPLIGPRIFLLLYPAIFIGSFFGAFWSSMFATLFAALSACVLLFSGQHNLDTAADSFAVIIFFITGLISIYIGQGSLAEKLNGDRLKDAVSTRDEFLSIASHELKTPITSLKLQIQMTKRKIVSGRAVEMNHLVKSFDVQEKQVLRLSELVEELLNVTRIQAGKFDYRYEEVDLGQVINDIVDRFSHQFKAAHCKLSIYTSKSVIVLADPFRLEQVLVNLLSNALKYAAGKPVEIQTVKDSFFAKIIVKDSGMGIPPEKLEKIFDRYERADSNANISGLGLGLYIVKEIVSQHNGRVSVESTLNEGSTFTVEIPLASSNQMASMPRRLDNGSLENLN